MAVLSSTGLDTNGEAAGALSEAGFEATSIVLPPKENPITGAAGLNPPVVAEADEVEAEGAGKVNAPTLGGCTTALAEAAGAACSVAAGTLSTSMPVFSACSTSTSIGFPASFLISLKCVLYSFSTLLKASPRSRKGSCFRATSRARMTDVLRPRIEVRYFSSVSIAEVSVGFETGAATGVGAASAGLAMVVGRGAGAPNEKDGAEEVDAD